MTRLVDAYDALIVDADGVIYRGPTAVPHAIQTLREIGAHLPWCVLTNNAALPPSDVAERITALDLPIEPQDVVTSPQGATAFLREAGVPAGSPVLIVGGPGIDEAVLEAGYVPVRDRSAPGAAEPVAVVQGFGPDVGWRDLAEAGYAIASGALWVATNLDMSIPTERGIAPGNGSLVGVVRQAVGRDPDAVTGKPEPLLFHLAARRMAAQRPLVLGDRLDTDIRGANRAGMDSFLVLTGIAGAPELTALVDAEPDMRPTYIGADLRALLGPADLARIDGGAGGTDALANMRRVLARLWQEPDAHQESRSAVVRAIDDWSRARDRG